jgi:hypothetical protein
MVPHASSAAGPLHPAGGELLAEATALIASLDRSLRDLGQLVDVDSEHVAEAARDDLSRLADLLMLDGLTRGALRPEKPAEEVA